MRPYSVGEDCIILEAALIAGVHHIRGTYGGINQLSRKFAKTHRTLCQSRGLASPRSIDSLKMRMYRLFSVGILKWGAQCEKERVFRKLRPPLRNIGTSEQKATRDFLIKMLFAKPEGTLTHVTQAEAQETDSPLIRQALAAARKARRATRAINPEKNDGTAQCHAIAKPEENWNILTRRSQLDEVERGEGDESVYFTANVPQTYKAMDLLVHDRRVEEQKAEARKGKLSTYQAAYKENMKTYRDLAMMRHDTLDLMRRECESHRDFLKRSLADIAEQQRSLLQIMKTVAENEE